MNPQASHIPTKVRRTVLGLCPGAEIILFGSRARGDANEQSDWDFLILLDQPCTESLVARIKDQLYDLELETGTVLCSIVRTKQEWSSPEYGVLPIKREIEREGIPV